MVPFIAKIKTLRREQVFFGGWGINYCFFGHISFEMLTRQLYRDADKAFEYRSPLGTSFWTHSPPCGPWLGMFRPQRTT